jgi:two-component sensor histidine kinase
MPEFPMKREITLERVLLHELIHRINNEYSSLISAVSRTAARAVNQDVKVALADIIEVLYHHTELHRALQMPEQDKHVDAAAYLEKLCQSISRSKLDDMKIDLVVATSPLQLQSDRCWRLGLIVYELITNAARHAFGNGSGQVRVKLWRARKFVECSVTDDGSAPAGVQRGRGLTIVHGLVEDLDGRIYQKFGHTGSRSILTFPYNAGPQRGGGPEERDCAGVAKATT